MKKKSKLRSVLSAVALFLVMTMTFGLVAALVSPRGESNSTVQNGGSSEDKTPVTPDEILPPEDVIHQWQPSDEPFVDVKPTNSVSYLLMPGDKEGFIDRKKSDITYAAGVYTFNEIAEGDSPYIALDVDGYATQYQANGIGLSYGRGMVLDFDIVATGKYMPSCDISFSSRFGGQELFAFVSPVHITGNSDGTFNAIYGETDTVVIDGKTYDASPDNVKSLRVTVVLRAVVYNDIHFTYDFYRELYLNGMKVSGKWYSVPSYANSAEFCDVRIAGFPSGCTSDYSFKIANFNTFTYGDISLESNITEEDFTNSVYKNYVPTSLNDGFVANYINHRDRLFEEYWGGCKRADVR